MYSRDHRMKSVTTHWAAFGYWCVHLLPHQQYIFLLVPSILATLHLLLENSWNFLSTIVNYQCIYSLFAICVSDELKECMLVRCAYVGGGAIFRLPLSARWSV